MDFIFGDNPRDKTKVKTLDREQNEREWLPEHVSNTLLCRSCDTTGRLASVTKTIESSRRGHCLKAPPTRAKGIRPLRPLHNPTPSADLLRCLRFTDCYGSGHRRPERTRTGPEGDFTSFSQPTKSDAFAYSGVGRPHSESPSSLITCANHGNHVISS